jgi:hypothetical protein
VALVVFHKVFQAWLSRLHTQWGCADVLCIQQVNLVV